jgi:hypothetical protein
VDLGRTNVEKMRDARAALPDPYAAAYSEGDKVDATVEGVCFHFELQEYEFSGRVWRMWSFYKSEDW